MWVIQQNIVHKFSPPLEVEIWNEKIYHEIGRLLLGCRHCMLKENWNEVDFYEIVNHRKVKHFKLFGFIKGEMIYDKHTEKIFKWKILFNNFWEWIVLNSDGKVVARIQNYGDVSVLIDRNWRILWQLSKDNAINFSIPETDETVALKISWN